MVSFPTKLVFLFLIPLLHLNGTNGLENETYTEAVLRTAMIECENLFSRSSDAFPPFVFAKTDSLSLLTVTAVTPENVRKYFNVQKLPLKKLKYDLNQKGVITLLLQHKSAYPTSITVNSTREYIPNNSYQVVGQQKISERSYPSKSVQTSHGTIFTTMSTLQLKAPLIFVNATYTESTNISLRPKFTSRIGFVYRDNKWYNDFQIPTNLTTDTHFWVAAASSKPYPTLKACLPMYRVEGNDNWIYQRFMPTFSNDEDPADLIFKVLLIFTIMLSTLMVSMYALWKGTSQSNGNPPPPQQLTPARVDERAERDLEIRETTV